MKALFSARPTVAQPSPLRLLEHDQSLLISTISPKAAKRRFGKLTGFTSDERIHVYRRFEAPDGIWQPVFDELCVLTGYCLTPLPEPQARVVSWDKERR